MIFSLGVLMVIQVSSAMGRQMAYSATRSTLVVLANEGLDSLQALPFDSLDAGTETDTVIVRGTTYERALTVTVITPMLSRIDVSLAPAAGGGPSHALTSYAAANWLR